MEGEGESISFGCKLHTGPLSRFKVEGVRGCLLPGCLTTDLERAVHLEDEEQPGRAGPTVHLPLFGHGAVFDDSSDQRQHLLPERVQGSEEPVVGHVEGLVWVDEQQDVAHGEHVEQVEAVLSLQAFPEVVCVGVAGTGAQRLAGPQQLPAVAHRGEQQVQHPALLVVESLDVAVRGAVLRLAEQREDVFVRQRVDDGLFGRPGLHVALTENTDDAQAVVPVSSVLLELCLQQIRDTHQRTHVCFLHAQIAATATTTTTTATHSDPGSETKRSE